MGGVATAKRGTGADAHREVRHFGGGLTGGRFTLEHAQHRVGAAGGDRRDGVGVERLGLIGLDPHPCDVRAHRRQIRDR